MEQLKTKLLVILSIGVISCQRTTKLEPLSNKKESEQTIYTEPDYNRLGYTEISFNGNLSQTEMNENEIKNLYRATKRMNIVIDSIRLLYSKEDIFWESKHVKLFIKSLEVSQQKWKSYYRTMLYLKFPKNESDFTFGMVTPTYKVQLINQRIRDLNPWLMGHPQGDISGGTIRTLEYSWNDIEESEKHLKRTKKSKNVPAKKPKNHNQEPDYTRLGYTEIPFNGWASQAEMNNNEYENVLRVDNRISTVIDSIRILYSNANWTPKQKDVFLKALELSQKRWLTYYRSLLVLKFPDDVEYGSSFGQVSQSYMTDLKNQRIRDLNPWLMGIPKRNIGGGTIRVLK